jgi:outer membrane protein TolC
MQTGFENDKVSLANLLQIQISRREMQQKYDDLLQMQRTAENNFNLFIGQAPGTELSLPDTLSFPNDDRTFDEPDFSSHPLILALQAKEEAGNTVTRIKRREKLPRIGVGVEYSFIDKEGMGTDAGQDALMASMSITIPWQRKALKSQVKEAELLSRQTRQELELKRLNLQQQYNRVRSELKITQNDYLTGISINGMLEQKLMLSKTAYENGEVGFDAVIQSENKFYMGLISAEEAKIKYISTSAEMDYLLKKGN